MRLRRTVLAGLLVAAACGGRTSLHGGDTSDGFEGWGGEGGDDTGGSAGSGAEPDAGTSCRTSADCATDDLCAPESCVDGECLPTRSIGCDDADVCTVDRCDPSTGGCVHEPPVDADGDGYASKEGVDPACGRDCDDGDPDVYPGAAEACDGRDNDCDGVIDEGTAVGYSGVDPIRISPDDLERAGRAGLATDGTNFGITYTGLSSKRWRSYFTQVGAFGQNPLSPVLLSEVNADSYAGLLTYSDGVYATAWSDARQSGNYEVYFNRLSPAGQKYGPDLRLSEAQDFSLHSVSVPTGSEQSLVVWDDQRADADGGPPAQIYGRFVDAEGQTQPELLLTPEENHAEYPWIARGDSRFGLVYTTLDGDSISAHFMTFDFAGGDPGPIVDLEAPDAQEPSLIASGGVFVAAWQVYGDTYGPSIWGAVLSPEGKFLHLPAPLTSGATVARTHSMVALGDRFVLIWADDFAGDYALYSETLDLNLNVLRERERITFSSAYSLWPMAVVGPNGSVGVLYDDWQTGARQVFFTRLDCFVE